MMDDPEKLPSIHDSTEFDRPNVDGNLGIEDNVHHEDNENHSVMIRNNSNKKKKVCCRNRTCCRYFMTRYNPLSSDPSCCERLRYGFLCPPHGYLATFLSVVIVLVFIWAVLWAVTGIEALPGHNFFGLYVMFVCCLIGGNVVKKIKLPGLLGMLLVGCLLRNVPYINVGKDIDKDWSAALRNIALVVILTKAGLGLDPGVLKKLSCVVFRLAFVPCLVETIVVAICSHLLLGVPWIWGFMLGFVLAAVSPAVVVPSMLHLEEQGLGTDKGIPTLVIAAASVDDVLAISGFGVVLGIAFSQSNLVLTIFRGPLEALLGIVYGILVGITAWYLPHWKNTHLKLFRFIILFCGGLFAVFGSNMAKVPGAGALGCLTLSFTAAIGWREEDGLDNKNMMDIMEVLWMISQPFLFGLIGNEIVITDLNGDTVGLGIATLFIGLSFRMVASFLAVFRTDLTWKERFFIPFAWLPKATVQAAIGPVAFDTAVKFGKGPGDIEYEMGLKIVTIAVLVILITAPLGAALIALLGPKFLNKSPKSLAQLESRQQPSIERDIESNEEAQVRLTTFRSRPSGASIPEDFLFSQENSRRQLELED